MERRIAGARVIAAAVLLALAVLPARAASPAVPLRLADVHGAPVDLAALAAGGRVFVVTLKSTACPVCAEQLRRLRRLVTTLRACRARLVVVVPGDARAVAAVAEASGLPYPFVADPDGRIARAAGLALGGGEMTPALLEVDAAGAIVWAQPGRAPGAYSDPALLDRLGCAAPSEPDRTAAANPSTMAGLDARARRARVRSET